MKSIESAIPRIALFISDPTILTETEHILRTHYSSLLIVMEKAKLKEFPFSLIIIVDSIKDICDIQQFHPVEGTRVLLIVKADGEEVAAAFEAGADDCITYPFPEGELIGKTEKYMQEILPIE